MSVGFSEYTAQKQEYYNKILGWQMGVAFNAIRKWGLWTNYLLIDATAGSGIVEGLTGSPILALRKLLEGTNQNWRAVFLEEDARTFASLRVALWEYEPACAGRMEVWNARYQDYLDGLARDDKQLGLLYVDENGVPNFDAIRKFAERRKKMDILISVCANSIKRVNGANAVTGRAPLPRVEELIKLKDTMLIREPEGKWQWTFILATNGPFDKAYKNIQFYPLNTPRGREYFERVNYTQGERDELHQIALPNL